MALIQTYAVVCVTIDVETEATYDMHVSDASEMPVDSSEVWDVDSDTWTRPDRDVMTQYLMEGDNAVAIALKAYKNAVQAQKEAARWNVCGPRNRQELLDMAKLLNESEDGTSWEFPDGSIMFITDDLEHAEAYFDGIAPPTE